MCASSDSETAAATATPGVTSTPSSKRRVDAKKLTVNEGNDVAKF